MHVQQRQRARELLQAKGMNRALFANAATVRWLSGFTAPVQLGASVWSRGPSLLWYEDGSFTLIVLDAYLPLATGFSGDPNCLVESYEGYTIQGPVDGARHLRDALVRVIAGSGVRDGKVRFEKKHLPQYLFECLNSRFSPSVELIPLDGWPDPLRAIKTDEELKKLRDNFALTDIGHAAARRAIRVEAREIDVWTEVHAAIERAAGERVPLGNDCIVGHREANIGGWPSDLPIEPNDSVIVDLSTLQHGYWSDSCATYYPNEPTSKQSGMHHIAASPRVPRGLRDAVQAGFPLRSNFASQ